MPSHHIPLVWFKQKNMYAIGFMAAGASAGGIIFPILIDKLISRIGFGWTTQFHSAILLHRRHADDSPPETQKTTAPADAAA